VLRSGSGGEKKAETMWTRVCTAFVAALAVVGGVLASSEVAVEGVRRELFTFEAFSGSGDVFVLVVAPGGEPVVEKVGGNEGFFEGLEAQFEEVADFLRNNSGGVQDVHFVAPTNFTYVASFNRDQCDEVGDCVNSEALALSLADEYAMEDPAYISGDDFARIVILFEGGCACLPNGYAETFGRIISVGLNDESDDIPRVVAQQFGHTNGAYHIDEGSAGYSNIYSIMGNTTGIPQGHFSLSGKVAFNWLDLATQIKTFALSGHPECPPADGGSCMTNGEVDISAHDLGSLEPEKVYGARIFTGKPGAALWIEYRAGFPEQGLENGALLLWSPESAPVGADKDSLLSGYGPVDSIPYSQNSDSVPVGATIVYDLDGTGAQITVLSRSEASNEIRVKVEFVPRTFELDYGFGERTGSGILGNSPVAMTSLRCDNSAPLIFSSNEISGVSLYRIFVPQPLELVVTQVACTGGNDALNLASLYLYDSYPLQLFQQSGPIDFAVGAIERLQLRCDGEPHILEFTIRNLYDEAKDLIRPMPLDFYAVVNRQANRPSIPFSSIRVDLECDFIVRECRDNFYVDSNSACVQCALGQSSVTGSIGVNSCYEPSKAVQVTWNDFPNLNGIYELEATASGTAHVFKRTSPSVAYLLKDGDDGTWAILLDSDLQGNIQDPVKKIVPVLSRIHKHPLAAGTQLSNGTTSVSITAAAGGPLDADYVGPYDNTFSLLADRWSFQNADSNSPSTASVLTGQLGAVLFSILFTYTIEN